MRTLITIAVVTLFVSNVHCQKTILINGEGIHGFTIEGITSYDLNNPGDNFEKLRPLGNLKDSSYFKSFAYEQYVLEYEGIKLVYIDNSGKPQLSEIILYGKNIKLCLDDYVLHQGMVPAELLSQTNSARSTLSIEYDSDKPQAKKYGKYFSYMEIFLNETDGTIDKIIYKHSVL